MTYEAVSIPLDRANVILTRQRLLFSFCNKLVVCVYNYACHEPYSLASLPHPLTHHSIPFTLTHAYFNEQPSYTTNYVIEDTQTNAILLLIEINKTRPYLLRASFLLSHLCLY